MYTLYCPKASFIVNIIIYYLSKYDDITYHYNHNNLIKKESNNLHKAKIKRI